MSAADEVFIGAVRGRLLDASESNICNADCAGDAVVRDSINVLIIDPQATIAPAAPLRGSPHGAGEYGHAGS